MAEALSLNGRTATVREVMVSVLADRDYYEATGGGVTLSGGEPLAQPEGAVALASACRDSGVPVYLDTCGFVAPAVFDTVAAAMDGFLFDIKLASPAKHREYTGFDNAVIQANFRRAVGTGKPVRIRLVIVPGVTDTEENLAGVIRLAADCSFHGPVDLLPYHRMGAGKYRSMGLPYPMEGALPPSRDELELICARFQQAGFETMIQ